MSLTELFGFSRAGAPPEWWHGSGFFIFFPSHGRDRERRVVGSVITKTSIGFLKALLSHLSNHRSVLAVLLQKCREGGPEAPSNFGSMKKFIFRVLTLQFSVCLTQCFYVETFETNIFRLNYVVSFC